MRGRTVSAMTIVALGCILAGCGPSVQNITMRSAASVAPVADQATIVIIQPTTAFQSLSILDAQGRLLGQLDQRSRTMIRVPPGPIRLYVIPETRATWGDRIDGSVRAGRVYYATISLRRGGVAFRALNSRSRDNRWAQRDAYMARTPPVEMDPARVSIAVRELGDPEYRAERTTDPEDGL